MHTWRFVHRDGSIGYVSADNIIAAIEWASLSHAISTADIIEIKRVSL